MNPAASEPVALSQSQFSPNASAVYPPAAQHNTAVIGSLATVSVFLATPSFDLPHTRPRTSQTTSSIGL